MKALRFYDIQDLRYEEADDPVITAPDEVIVKVKAVGICGSDIARYRSLGPYIKGNVWGHEFAGEVVETGAEVTAVKAGDRVVGCPNLVCHTCEYCTSGHPSRCETLNTIGALVPGAFAEYIKMPAKNLVHMVEGMTFEEGALTEPATVAIHGLYQSHIQMGYEVAVVGCGNIGLMSIAWSKAFGAKRVFALDVDDGQLEMAKSFGADVCINTRDADFHEAIRQYGPGVDLAIESAGNPFFTRFLMRKAGFAFSLTDVIEQMDRFTRENHVFFAKEVFFEIATVLFVKLNRIDSAAPAPAGRPVQMDMMGRMVEYVARALGMTGLRRSDTLSIERLILAGDFRPEVQSINDFTLYGVICHFLLEVGGELHVGLLSDDLLVKSLLSHIRSMGNWRSGAFDNRQDYASVQVFIQVQSVAEKKFYILEKFLQYKMTEPMKDSIIIHICAALLRSRDNSHVCSVIVSCPGSMATSKYIEAQLKRYFNLNIVDILTTRQVVNANLKL